MSTGFNGNKMFKIRFLSVLQTGKAVFFPVCPTTSSESCHLTNDDEAGRLEELLVVPGGMLCLQDVTHSVVLPQPQRGVHSQTGKKSEHFVTDGDLILCRDPGRVVHPNGNILYSGRVHFAVHYLLERRRQNCYVSLDPHQISLGRKTIIKPLILYLILEFSVFVKPEQ